MKTILTFTGLSGSGKTTLAKWILDNVPGACMIPSHTTRRGRQSDLKNEYRHITSDEFRGLRSSGEFLWTVSPDGMTHYGTKGSSIIEVFDSDPISAGIMILTPDGVSNLVKFLESLGEKDSHVPVFITPPPRNILEERLRKRGESEGGIKARLEGGRDWEEEARNSGIPYTYINNDTAVESAIEELRRILEK